MRTFALVWFAFACAAQDTPVFRATSDLVLLDVSVLHRKTGTPARSVERSQLRVLEDGAPQEIAFFSRDELPLSAVLLFDLTDSVRPVLKRLAEGARSALAHFKARDRIAVMDYAASANLLCGFTEDRSRTIAAIEAAAGHKSDEAAFFNEAVWQAAMQLAQSATPGSRRVIIWLTDNIPNVPSDGNRESHGKSLGDAPLHTEAEAIRAAHEADVAIAPLLLKSRWAPFYEMFALAESGGKSRFPPGDARKYAEVTGGDAIELRGKAVEQRLADLIDGLRSRYTIGYRPSQTKSAGTFCRLQVLLDPTGALRPKEWILRARSGYYRK